MVEAKAKATSFQIKATYAYMISEVHRSYVVEEKRQLKVQHIQYRLL